MAKMSVKAYTRFFLNRYFNMSLDLHAQAFNLLACAGMLAGLITAASSVVTGTGILHVCINLSASVLAFVLLGYAHRSGRYHLCYILTVVIVFLIAFPVLFFTAGGYRSGMPGFFVFAVVFTALMLEKRERAFAVGAEFVIYAGCCIVAFLRPETVSLFDTELAYTLDVLTGFAVSSGLLLLVILLYIRIYENRQAVLDVMNRELEERNTALEKYDDMKTAFLTTVAHEIKTPLAVIKGNARDIKELLELEAQETGGIQRDVSQIEEVVGEINGILMDLLDTAAIENGRLSLRREATDVADLLKKACGVQFAAMNVNGNRLEYNMEPGLPKLWIDPQRIGQVMQNLLSNALRHTKDGLVTIGLRQEEGRQLVSVSDNGEGMDAGLLEVAFKQYVSADKDYWRRGIGLYICRQIVSAHGGEIWIESAKGSGTSVFFTLGEA